MFVNTVAIHPDCLSLVEIVPERRYILF